MTGRRGESGGIPRMPAPPAHVAEYVDVLGVDLAVELFLTLGGSEVYFPAAPQGRGKLEAVVGAELAATLADLSPSLTRRIPIPKQWIAQVLSGKGLPVAEIARRLHVSDVTVRRHLTDRRGRDDRQLPLL